MSDEALKRKAKEGEISQKVIQRENMKKLKMKY
jgi:hypothetical protein